VPLSRYKNIFAMKLSAGLAFVYLHPWSPFQIAQLVEAVILATPDVSLLAGSPPFADGIGTNAMFSVPYAVRISSDGIFALIVDQNNFVLRHIVLSTSAVTTLAGVASTSGLANGIGTNAKFKSPNGISLSSDDSFALVTEPSLHLLRRVEISTASVTTFSGNETLGFSDGVGTTATFNSLKGVEISPDGTFALERHQQPHYPPHRPLHGLCHDPGRESRIS
jgi:hypothetical protein